MLGPAQNLMSGAQTDLARPTGARAPQEQTELRSGQSGNRDRGGPGDTLKPKHLGSPANLGTQPPLGRSRDYAMAVGGAEQTEKAPYIRPSRFVIALFFFTAYLGLVVSLVWWLLSEKKAIEDVVPSDSEECGTLICPGESICTNDPLSGEAQCTSISPDNVQTVELIIGIVIGIPAAVCLPCTVQWVIRTCCPSVWQWLNSSNAPWNRPVSEEQSEANPVMDLETLGSMIGKLDEVQRQHKRHVPGVKHVPKDGKAEDAKKHKRKKKDDAHGARPGQSNNLDELFTPMARKQKAQGEAIQDAESEIDILFARKPKAQGLTERDEGNPVPPDLIGQKSGTPLQPTDKELESAWSALLHRPARPGLAASEKKRALPPVPVSSPSRPDVKHPNQAFPNASRDARSEISEGLSLLFTSMHRSKTVPHGRTPAQSTLQGSSRIASLVASEDAFSRNEKYCTQDVAQEGYAVDKELGDPPDFWGYALRLAESAKLAGGVNDTKSDFGEHDETDVSVADSFESLEPTEFIEFFHHPLGFRPL